MSAEQSWNRYEEVTLQTTPIFQGRVISLQVDKVKLPNGETADREIVRHPGAVAVMALVEGKLLVVEQYRKPLGRSLMEIPAGKLENGENPEAAARRELEEETGFRCERLRHLTSFYTSPGFADEQLHVYVAEQLTRGETHLDDDEFLDGHAITLAEAERYMAEGRIADAKTILAIYAWKLLLAGKGE